LGTKTSNLPVSGAAESPLFPVRKSIEETRTALSAKESANPNPKTQRSCTEGEAQAEKGVRDEKKRLYRVVLLARKRIVSC
jgi:hypothetical protein